jgi:hypothetical protein
MGYKAVTLGDEDVEWITPDNDFDEIREAIWHDDQFEAWLSRVDIAAALTLTTRFHRVIANQLIERAEKDAGASEWAGQTIALCTRLRLRRQQVQRRMSEERGADAMLTARDTLSALYPRAIWGSARV